MTVYPNPLAGQKATAARLAAMLPLIVVKATDTSRNTTVTPTADPELSLAVEANATYVLDGWLITSAAALTSNLLCSVNGPTGALGRWGLVFPSTISTTDPDSVRVATNGLGSALTFGHPLITIQFGGPLYGTVVTSTTPGNVSFNWSQNTSDANNVTFKQYSWMRLTRVA
jgi:hypothetical protein